MDPRLQVAVLDEGEGDGRDGVEQAAGGRREVQPGHHRDLPGGRDQKDERDVTVSKRQARYSQATPGICRWDVIRTWLEVAGRDRRGRGAA